MGAGFWRAVASGLNATAMVTVGVIEATTDLDVPGRAWALWTMAAVGWLAYSAHLSGKDHERRKQAADDAIAAMVERARRNGAAQ